MREILVESQ